MALGEDLPPPLIPQDPDTMYIHDLCVHPDAAASGHGGRLYSAVLGKCRELGLPCLSITSVCGSQGWWQKKGFRPVQQLSATGLATLNQSYSECEGAVVMKLCLPSEPVIPDEATISELMFMPAEFPRDGHAHEIVTGLFLGDRDAAINAEQLGYLAVLNCSIDSQLSGAWTEVRESYQKAGIRCLELPMDDATSSDISEYLPQGADFVHECIEQSLPVLVHCSCGKSRSTCEVISYLMKHRKMNFYEAFSLTRSKRQLAYPKWCLLEQVLHYEAQLFGRNSIPIELVQKYHTEFREGSEAYKLEQLVALTNKGEAYCSELLARAEGDITQAGNLFLMEL